MMVIVKMMMMTTIEMIGCDQLMSMEVVCRLPAWMDTPVITLHCVSLLRVYTEYSNLHCVKR